MYFQSDFHTQVEEKGKKVTIYRNGDSELKCEINLSSTTKFSDIRRVLERKMDKTFTRLRLFNQQGVEIMQDDLEFIKNGATLYASRGEEFDANSSFAEFDLVQELGEGGFGKVVLGVHRKTGQKFAIKIIKTHMIGNAQDIDMVFRESEVLKSLNHNNIVKIYNCFTLSNMQVVFIMEYLEGGELLSLVEQKGHFSENEAREYFKQLVGAIAYCHTRKVIHRDLKLENLLLTSKTSNEIKAIDFGIAGMASKLNVDNADVGSIRYMPPEILSGSTKVITPLVDVWAMGVILYGMLFGELPFTGTTGPEVAQQIREGQYEIPKEFRNKISAACKDVLKQTLQVDPEKRISAVDLQYHPWISGAALEKIEQLIQSPIIKEVDEEEKDTSTSSKKSGSMVVSFDSTPKSDLPKRGSHAVATSQKTIGTVPKTSRTNQAPPKAVSKFNSSNPILKKK